MNDITKGDTGSTVDDFVTIPDIPVLPANNIVNPNQVRSGVTRGIQQLGSDKVYSDGGNNQIIVADTVPRVLMGDQATFGEGFYVSKAGFNVKTNTDPANLIFNSSQNVIKIVQSGTYTLSVSNPIAKDEIDSGSVAHNLGFIPAHIVYVTIPSTITDHPYIAGKLQKLPVTFAGGASIEAIIDANADATNINFYAVNVWGGALTWGLTSLTFRYYLLQETAATI